MASTDNNSTVTFRSVLLALGPVPWRCSHLDQNSQDQKATPLFSCCSQGNHRCRIRGHCLHLWQKPILRLEFTHNLRNGNLSFTPFHQQRLPAPPFCASPTAPSTDSLSSNALTPPLNRDRTIQATPVVLDTLNGARTRTTKYSEGCFWRPPPQLPPFCILVHCTLMYI